jgi:hypothetical protein
MALGTTHHLAELNTSNVPEGKAWPGLKVPIYELTIYLMWHPRRLTSLWVFTTCYGDSSTFRGSLDVSQSYGPP